jgi:hypothetical protein
MFANGALPGNIPKQNALKVLPEGTTCKVREALGIRGYVVSLPEGRAIASAGTASGAWEKAQAWAERNKI